MSHVTVSGAPDAPAESATETNRRIVRRAFDAWRDGTGTITDLFAPDMVWRIEGRSLASKEYGDGQQFVDEVLAPFAARFSASAPAYYGETRPAGPNPLARDRRLQQRLHESTMARLDRFVAGRPRPGGS